jgi:hypothetical protein
MIDAVVTYHTNPFACGVARFNQQLADHLDVPMVPLQSVRSRDCLHPLVSVKPSEIPPAVAYGAEPDFLPKLDAWWPTYDVLLHGPLAGNCGRFVEQARRVFHADQIGCPATVQGNPHRGAYKVLTFGMAHKLVIPHFQALKARLDWEQPDYTISLSTAVHEGSPWDAALTEAECAMRAIFGDKLRVLGFLADDALAKELQDCDAVAMFFAPALRKNNTSYWAAVAAGKTIYTNRDEHSPQEGDPPVTWDSVVEVLRG